MPSAKYYKRTCIVYAALCFVYSVWALNIIVLLLPGVMLYWWSIYWLQNAFKLNWSRFVMSRLVYNAVPSQGFNEMCCVLCQKRYQNLLFLLRNVYDQIISALAIFIWLYVFYIPSTNISNQQKGHLILYIEANTSSMPSLQHVCDRWSNPRMHHNDDWFMILS